MNRNLSPHQFPQATAKSKGGKAERILYHVVTKGVPAVAAANVIGSALHGFR